MAGSLLRHLSPRAKKGVYQRLAVMTYQLGHICHGLVYAEHSADRKDERAANAYRAESRLALCDLVAQCRLISEEQGWNWQKVVADGEERYRERMQELERGQI
jgi:hypothetical protein